jgi:hypothetical protein
MEPLCRPPAHRAVSKRNSAKAYRRTWDSPSFSSMPKTPQIQSSLFSFPSLLVRYITPACRPDPPALPSRSSLSITRLSIPHALVSILFPFFLLFSRASLNLSFPFVERSRTHRIAAQGRRLSRTHFTLVSSATVRAQGSLHSSGTLHTHSSRWFLLSSRFACSLYLSLISRTYVRQ